MAEHHQEYPVATMCRVLEVSVSGDSAWRKREPSLHSREEASLANKIKGAFQSHRCVYGSPRIHAELHAQGIHCARKRVARLMRELELVAKRPRHPAGHDEKRGRSISSSEPAPTGLSC